MKYIIAVALFIFVLVADLATDYSRWKKGKPIHHTRGALIRGIGLIPVGILLGFAAIPMILFTYWLLFDGFFNVLRKFNWWFKGSDDADDAHLDNFIENLSQTEHMILKLGVCAISITVFILSL